MESVNFRLEPGERIALVGANGHGKTTIVKLLTRMYDLTSKVRSFWMESICANTTWKDLWKNIGVIFQDFVRYDA